MAVPRVLAYAPYFRSPLHGKTSATVLNGLRLRGAQITHVLCDGLFSQCDLYWPWAAEPPEHACAHCQAESSRVSAAMGLDYRWLGRYITLDEHAEAEAWAAALAVDELLDARFENWEIGAWVRSSLQSHFRASQPTATDPEVERVLRRYLASGLTACRALERLIDDVAPDVMWLFNGRTSSNRIALEIARRRGLRVVVHELGPRDETLMLVEDANSLSLAPLRDCWREWADVPLSADELSEVTNVLAEREHGRGTGGLQYSREPEPEDGLRGRLGLVGGRPLWVLFTSSDDEVAGDPDYASPFATQREWVARTIAWAARRPELDLVVRVHPNTGSRRSEGHNHVQLAEMAALGTDLPANVRMVAADEEVSSYTLMEMCAVGLVWASTAGVELAVKGRTVVAAAGSYVSGTAFVHTVSDERRYERLLDGLVRRDPRADADAVRRLALRLAHAMFVRLPVPFPLVAMPARGRGELRYRSLEELLPGRDAALDRVCRIVLDGAPVCPAPTERERARTTAAEDAWLALRGQRVVLADADELIADPQLLHDWGALVSAARDITLFIHTPPTRTASLVAAVAAAGLDREDGPPLVAGVLDGAALRNATGLLSRQGASGLPPDLPRVTLPTRVG